MSNDITNILKSWPYGDDDEINVRMIEGDDGSMKVQMRIDMGVLQLEMDGHPAGSRPRGFDSWLTYYENAAKNHESRAIEDTFTLRKDEVKRLQSEGVQYYYRYLSLMKLEDYERVVRDTDRNLRMFSFVKKYAVREVDRWLLDQYRPYVIMINTQAKASQILHSETPDAVARVIDICDHGINRIIAFYHEYGIADQMDDSIELTILRTLKEQIAGGKPALEQPSHETNLPETLEQQLHRAVMEERYEDAAELRDLIRDHGKRHG